MFVFLFVCVKACLLVSFFKYSDSHWRGVLETLSEFLVTLLLSSQMVVMTLEHEAVLAGRQMSSLLLQVLVT